MPTLVHGGLSCVALRLAWTGGDAGEGSRVLYRLWRTEEGGHLIEAAVVPRRVGRRPRRAERRAAWVGEGVDAEALLARLASPDDPVHPIHLADVVRDALWLAARGEGPAWARPGAGRPRQPAGEAGARGPAEARVANEAAWPAV